MEHRNRFGRVSKALVLVSSLLTACGGRAQSTADDTESDEQGASLPVQSNNDQSSLIGFPDPNPIVAPDGAQIDRDPQEPTPRFSGEAIRVGSAEGGVEGLLYVETSPLGTTLELVPASGRICVRGQLAPVPNGDYPNYWGGEVGLLLAPSLAEEARPGEALDTRGFAFRLEGALPPVLRFRVGAVGEVPRFSQFCQHVALDTGVRIEIRLEALIRECWNTIGDPFPEGSGATMMSWQVPANEASVGRFDFCIEDIQTLR